jgi:hypothetical protein
MPFANSKGGWREHRLDPLALFPPAAFSPQKTENEALFIMQ